MRCTFFAILGGSNDDHLGALVANSRLEVREALNRVGREAVTGEQLYLDINCCVIWFVDVCECVCVW